MCLTTAALIHLGIVAIVIIAAIMIGRIVLGQFGLSGPMWEIVKIVLIAIAAVVALLFFADLLQCLVR